MKFYRGLFFCCALFGVDKSYAQSIAIYEQLNGRLDYTAIGNTLNIIENGAFFDCYILTTSEAFLNMEEDQNILAAYLYWAGSGAGDFEISLNSIAVEAERTF